MEINQNSQEKIKDSFAARLAFFTAIIPLVGLLLYFPLAFVAMYDMGYRGRAGSTLLFQGLNRLLFSHFVTLLCIATYWFFPRYLEIPIKQRLTFAVNQRNMRVLAYDEQEYECGYIVRSFAWPPKDIKVGIWTADYKVEEEYPTYFARYLDYTTYSFGKKEGEFTSYWSNGQKHLAGQYSNDKKIGPWTRWHPNGTVKEKMNYQNDQLCGQYFSWDAYGQPENSGEYTNGKPSGNWVYRDKDRKYKELLYEEDKTIMTTFHWNGKKQSQGEIRDENKTGLWKEWHETGELKSEGKYVGSEENGDWTYWHSNGRKEGEILYNYGRIIKGTRWYPDGQIAEEFSVNNNVMNKRLWYEDGAIKEEAEITGSWRTKDIKWYPNKQKASEMISSAGICTTWYPNGQIESDRQQQKDNIGKWTYWYENGQKKSEGLQQNNNYIGQWTYWHPNGKKAREGCYNNYGLTIGKWVTYDEKGQIVEEKSYDDDGQLLEDKKFVPEQKAQP